MIAADLNIAPLERVHGMEVRQLDVTDMDAVHAAIAEVGEVDTRPSQQMQRSSSKASFGSKLPCGGAAGRSQTVVRKQPLLHRR